MKANPSDAEPIVDVNRPRRHTLFGVSESTNALRTEIDTAARTDAKVLLTGETGVGKEVVAHEVHCRSRRARSALITVNCAGVPDTLLESEFFGHTRGSFTGAFRDSPGVLRQAHGGTVFLDEVGEMSLRMQALFLRFLETGEIQTVGAGHTSRRVDVRVITATNRNLLESVAARKFREDLYYRLNVLHLHIAPLRDRQADIPVLFDHYLQVYAAQNNRPQRLTLSPAALDVLQDYPWPGNIRELKNIVEWLVSRGVDDVIEPSHLPNKIVAAARPGSAVPGDGGASVPGVTRAARVDALLGRMFAHGESFWTSVYPAFMARDLTRDDMRQVIRTGLERTQGSYRLLLGLFNMSPDDYKRLLGFLKQYDCHVPFQPFRVHTPARENRRAVGGA